MVSSDIELVVKHLEKRHGAVIGLLSNDNSPVVDVISTGLLSLDIATGIGGVPRGRITEIFSPEGIGKTTLCVQIAAQAIREGLGVAYIDVEHKFDKEYAKDLGVDPDKLWFTQPNSAEAALNIAQGLATSGKFGLIIVDSVSQLVPQKEEDGSIGDSLPGLQARLMSQAMRVMAGPLRKSNTAIIFINQTRANMGGLSFGGSSETTSGGKALKFMASLRIRLGIVKRKKVGEDTIGQEVRAIVVKNSMASPYRRAMLSLYYGEGFCPYKDVLDLAIKHKVIDKSGSWYSYKDQDKVQGEEQMRLSLMENQDMFKSVWNDLTKVIYGNGDNTKESKENS